MPNLEFKSWPDSNNIHMGIHDSVMDPSFSNTNSEARPCKQLFAESLEIYSIRYIYYSYLCQTIFEVPFEFFKNLFLFETFLGLKLKFWIDLKC